MEDASRNSFLCQVQAVQMSDQAIVQTVILERRETLKLIIIGGLVWFGVCFVVFFCFCFCFKFKSWRKEQGQTKEEGKQGERSSRVPTVYQKKNRENHLNKKMEKLSGWKIQGKKKVIEGNAFKNIRVSKRRACIQSLNGADDVLSDVLEKL